jgi:cytochrome b
LTGYQFKADAPAQILVWSWFVRLTHWLVAILVIINFFNDTGWWHRVIGYILIALVFSRLLFGLIAGRKASIDTTAQAARMWWPSLADIKQHLREIGAGRLTPSLGHNPLGQLAAYAIWLLIFGLACTGWLSRTDMLWGEDWPVDVHRWFSNALQIMVLVHITAVILMSRLQKQNLILSMLHGRKSKSE